MILSTRPRHLQPEQMDAPDLDPRVHHDALRGLARINRFSGSARLLDRALARHPATREASRLTVLDLACGGGDVTVDLVQLAAQRGVRLDVIALDKSPTAVAETLRRAAAAHVSIDARQADVLDGDWQFEADVVMCSLFLHHLDGADAVRLLTRMRAATRRLLLVNDLVRSTTNYWLVWLASQMLTRSPVVHFDGPASVAGAFDRAELVELAATAGLEDAVVESRPPCRALLSWSRPA